MKKLIFLLPLLSAFTISDNSDCKINSWIADNYAVDAAMLVRKRVYYDDLKNYRDSLQLPQREVDGYLRIFSAVDAVNDSVFRKCNVRRGGVRCSWIPLSMDLTSPWVKKLKTTKGKSGNKQFDELMDKYGFSLENVQGEVFTLHSDRIVNEWAVGNELKKIKGVMGVVPTDMLREREMIVEDLKMHTITFEYFSNTKINSYELIKATPDVSWTYKMVNCQAVLVEFHNHLQD